MLLYRWVISRYVIGQFSVHKLLKGVPFLGFRDYTTTGEISAI